MSIVSVVRPSVLSLALIAASLSPAAAQVKVDVEMAPFAGGTFFLRHPPERFAIDNAKGANPYIVEGGKFDHAAMAGLTAGVRIADHWGVEGLFAWVPTHLTADNVLGSVGTKVSLSTLMYGGGIVYHFTSVRTVQPFLGVGIGGETTSYQPEAWQRDTELMGNVVVGANIPVATGISLRLDARDCITNFRSHVSGVDAVRANDFMVSAGLSVRTTVMGR